MTFPHRSGGQILVDQLKIQGVTQIACVPGESYLAALDALVGSGVETIVCRQEAGAAILALTSGRLTGRPGVCFVTRGPGAMNAAHGVHIAEHDSAPLILFVGQVERAMLGRGAFQEMDYRAVFGSIAKWVVEVDSSARLPEIIQRAFHVAMQGRPGPVVISLPEDVLTEMATVGDAPRAEPAPIWPGLTQMAELQKLLWAAERPIAIIGGAGWTQRAGESVLRFAARFELPLAASFRRASLVDNDHKNFVGEIGIGPNPKLRARIEAADLVLLIGGRMSEMASQGYTLFDVPVPKQKLAHVHADASELGRVYHPTLAIVATSAAFAASLEGLQPPNAVAWGEATRDAREEFEAWTLPPPPRGKLDMAQAMLAIRKHAPDAFYTNGAGNFALWPGRFLRFKHFKQQLGPTSGSMGFGLPAALAAQLHDRQRRVICFSGDGDFLMNGQEFATAVQFDLPIIALVIDNGMYGTIRMHQEREYPGRVSGTALKNPDFAAYARAFGGHGERVETDAGFEPALARALASGKPSILHCLIDPDAITPGTTLSAIRAAAEAAGR